MTRRTENATVALVVCALFILAVIACDYVLTGMDAQACRAGFTEACAR